MTLSNPIINYYHSSTLSIPLRTIVISSQEKPSYRMNTLVPEVYPLYPDNILKEINAAIFSRYVLVKSIRGINQLANGSI